MTVTLKERRGAKVVVTERMPLELKTGKMQYRQGTIEHRAQVRVCMYGKSSLVHYEEQGIGVCRV